MDSNSKLVTHFGAVSEGAQYVVKEDGEDETDLGYVRRIHAQSADYVVYLSKRRVHLVHKVDPEPPGFKRLWAEAQQLQSLAGSFLSSEELDDVLMRIASGLTVGIEGDVPLGMEELKQVRAYLRDQKVWSSKRSYCFMTMATGMAAALLGAGLAYLDWSWSVASKVTTDPAWFRWSYPSYLGLAGLALVGGGVGTFLATNNPAALKKVTGPVPAGFSGPQFGITRTLLGVASAFVVLLAVKAGVLSSTLFGDGLSTHGLLFVAVAAGFVEGWARDLLVRPKQAPAELIPPEPVTVPLPGLGDGGPAPTSSDTPTGEPEGDSEAEPEEEPEGEPAAEQQTDEQETDAEPVEEPAEIAAPAAPTQPPRSATRKATKKKARKKTATRKTRASKSKAARKKASRKKTARKKATRKKAAR